MGDNRFIKIAVTVALGAGLVTLGAGLVTLGAGLAATPASAQSLTDRFKSLFGGKSDEPVANAPAPSSENQSQSELTCPPVAIRAGASTYAVAAPGKEPVGNDVRFQATITKTARECSVNGGEITARIGIQRRVIAVPPARRRRFRCRCASRWCRVACRRRPSPPRHTRPRST